VEDELLRAAREGDESVAAFIVSMYAPRLLGYAHTLTSDLSDVDREMICERAVELACRKIDEFDPEKGTFVGWLRGFVRYGVLNWRRSTGSMADKSVEDIDPPLPPDTSDTTASNSRVAALAAAVRELSHDDQLLIALRYQEQLPTQDIALRLGVADATVRQRLTRLRAHLGRNLSS
jgi:RNA polymerase sigma-70 factor (ECF subfamily)